MKLSTLCFFVFVISFAVLGLNVYLYPHDSSSPLSVFVTLEIFVLFFAGIGLVQKFPKKDMEIMKRSTALYLCAIIFALAAGASLIIFKTPINIIGLALMIIVYTFFIHMGTRRKERDKFFSAVTNLK